MNYNKLGYVSDFVKRRHSYCWIFDITTLP
jgi:hypothetical protein